VERALPVEVKSVERVVRIREAQMVTYLRLGKPTAGLLINFDAALLKSGLRRFALSSSACSAVDLP
jgi:GxxExxY protein